MFRSEAGFASNGDVTGIKLTMPEFDPERNDQVFFLFVLELGSFCKYSKKSLCLMFSCVKGGVCRPCSFVTRCYPTIPSCSTASFTRARYWTQRYHVPCYEKVRTRGTPTSEFTQNHYYIIYYNNYGNNVMQDMSVHSLYVRF